MKGDAMTYIQEIIEKTIEETPGQEEFHQTLKEILPTLEPVFTKRSDYYRAGILERLVEPDRTMIFRVPWVDDEGQVQVNRGYRVQYNDALGPYKGGIRFHPSVNLGIMKFLGFEQIFKNALTTLPLGGAKGGANFDPKGKSEGEIMRFCQSFTNELAYIIGADLDVPAGDIGVGTREIGYMLGQYKKIRRGQPITAITGKDVAAGGSLLRAQSTGFGVILFLMEMLADNGEEIQGKKIAISGSGNVALATLEKAVEHGAKVVAMSDSSGYVYAEEGLDVAAIKRIKQIEKKPIEAYTEAKDGEYHEGSDGIWEVSVDIAIPCATQNELEEKHTKALIENGVNVVVEGANMPCTPEAIELLFDKGIHFGPAKAANAGGVATSGFEMTQNSIRYSWTAQEVEQRLTAVMKSIYQNCKSAAVEFESPKGIIGGANIAGFLKVGDAMMSHGV